MPAGLVFLSWVRMGMARAVTARSELTELPPARGNIDVVLRIAADEPAGSTQQLTAAMTAVLPGPGDAVGIDPRQVVRSFPPDGADDVRPNVLAAIELDRPDLPWLVASAAPQVADTPGARRGLMPWLSLVVVEDPLDALIEPPRPLRPWAQMTVDRAELPDLAWSWLWAHAQVHVADGDSVAGLLRDRPDRTLARLLAPRRLRPHTRYRACLVPTFKASGAGLGYSWTSADRTVSVPVYFSWRFTTGAAGDFEAAATRFTTVAGGRIGLRSLDLGPAFAVLGAPLPPVDLAGMLAPLQHVAAELDPGVSAALRAMLSRPGALTPPIYGARYADPIRDLNEAPLWLRQVNLDPRYRAAAALGVRLVQEHQEALVAAAWAQANQVREVNRLLRRAQVVVELAGRLYDRLGAPSSGDPPRDVQLLQLAARIPGAVALAMRSASAPASVVAQADIDATLSTAYLRLVRANGPLARRLGLAPLHAATRQLATRTLGPVRPAAPVAGPSLDSLHALHELRPLSPDRVRAMAPGRPLGGGVVVAGDGRVQVNSARAARALIVLTSPRGDLSRWMAYRLENRVGPLAWYLQLSGLGGPLFTAFLPPPPPDPARLPRVFVHETRAASTYVEFVSGGARQRAIVTVWVRRASTATEGTTQPAPYVHYQWIPLTPGKSISSHALNYRATRDPVYGDPPAPPDCTRLPSLRAFGAAATDLTRTGRMDLVFAWIDLEYPGGGPSNRYVLRALVARDLDDDGKPRSWSTELWCRELVINDDPREGSSEWQDRMSVTGVGNRVFVMFRDRLWVLRFDDRGGFESASPFTGVDWLRPGELVRCAIAAADFGGGSGADLLFHCTTRRGGVLDGCCRLRLDLDAPVSRWGPDLPAPAAPVDGTVSLLVGALDSDCVTEQDRRVAGFCAAAATVQERQVRIAALAAASSAEPHVGPVPDPVGPAARALRAQLDPRTTAATRLRRVRYPGRADGDEPALIAVAPRFPDPVIRLLRGEHQVWLLPDGAVPDEHVVLLDVNEQMIEALLVGMNHELGRELRWRQFPVHATATYFRRFWELRDVDGDGDMAPIESWDRSSALGDHLRASSSALTLLFVVRGALLRRFPRGSVYAARGKLDSITGGAPDLTQRAYPLLSGTLAPGISFFGFGPPLDRTSVCGSGPSDGWYFIFEEPASARWFGIDEPPVATGGSPKPPETWADLHWLHVATDGTGHFDPGDRSPLHGAGLPDHPGEQRRHGWAVSSADMAHILLQQPVRVAIHGSRMLGAPGGPP